MNMAKRDRTLIWHPLTQERTADLPIGIVRGEKEYLYAEDGKKYIDLISSWWVNLHGHAHPKIREAIYKQAGTLEHVIFAGFTHLPAVDLCEKMATLLPPHLQKFFFSDNGSTAVEVALKIAYQFWINQGEFQRTRFLSFEGGYHGDTFGAMSVGRSSKFHDNFQPFLFQVDTLPFPFTWMGDEEVEKKEELSLHFLERYLEKIGSSVACFIAEPLIQGASGMRICRPAFLKKVIEKLRAYGIITIFDEIMTGFGRTGTTFAFEQIGVVPDIMCLSKGLTGGFLPMALTVVSHQIYEAFLGTTFEKALAHGHSYTANPLGCAAALASLEVLLERKTQESIQDISQAHQENIVKLPNIVAPRFLGTIAAFNIGSQETIYTHPISTTLKKRFLEEGLLLRPLGNTIYLMPPYCVDKNVLHDVYQKMASILESEKFP